MELKEKRTFSSVMRAWHRDVGFLAVGLTIAFALSGIVLIYRDTSLLKSEKIIQKQLQPNLEASELGRIMHQRDFKILKTDGEVLTFKNGTYNTATGLAVYNEQSLPVFFEKLNELHKSPSGKMIHYLSVLYGILLLFLAVSSLWMYKPKSKMFRRGIYFTSAGVVIVVVVLLI